jgi:Zn finger protein HypA/HybF involved in hydrogenase expression
MIPIYMRELEEEVERLHQLEIHHVRKCMDCKRYMPKETLSFFCLKCSRKRIG